MHVILYVVTSLETRGKLSGWEEDKTGKIGACESFASANFTQYLPPALIICSWVSEDMISSLVRCKPN